MYMIKNVFILIPFLKTRVCTIFQSKWLQAHYMQENKAHMTENILTSLKAHQSRTKPSSRKSLSTVVRLKSRGQEPRFQSGFTSSCSFTSAVENWALLPILKTTLSTESLKRSHFQSSSWTHQTAFQNYISLYKNYKLR